MPDSPFLIRESTLEDVRRMVGVLREDDRNEVICLGLKPLRSIRRCYERSVIRRTAFLDGEIACIGGMAPASLVVA